MNKKISGFLMLSGAAAVFFYVFHIVLGGFLWHGYNHLMQPISDLTASGSPDRNLLQIILGFYGFFFILFSVNLAYYSSKNLNKTALAGGVLLILLNLVSLSYNFFPEDLPGTVLTSKGWMHIAVTFAIVPLTIFSPILIGSGLIKSGLKKAGLFSIICGILIFIFGGTTAAFFAKKLPYFGLVERINIGTLQLWIAVLSIYFFKKNAL